MSSKRH